MSRRPTSLLTLWVGLLLLVPSSSSAQTKLLRFPDIHGDLVAFCYAGDLWLAPASGGSAARLTSHPGIELFPKFSPDGKWIAFTGQYDGDEQVYVIPVSGGAPRRLTWYPARGPFAPRWGYDNQVYGWTNDGKRVVFRSLRDGWDLTDSRLYSVSVQGGLPRPFPMPESGAGDLSPDETKLVYSPLVRDFRTWKRYAGGWAQELYIFDLQTHETERVTDHPRADRDPMWIGDKIYFASDRDGTLNIYAYDTVTKRTQQITRSNVWDVRWPSDDGQSRIVYELNGELQVLDVRDGRSRPISIRVPDDGVSKRPSRIEVEDNIEGWSLSPKGERALFVARGDIFTAPIENGPTRNLTHSSNAHDKWARWSPDGAKIAFISDRDGEEEIYLVDQNGSGELEQLTDGGQAMRYAPEWAPDGKRLAFSDKDGKLYVLETKTRKLFEIADEERGRVHGYVWSPNGGHLAFSLSDPNEFNSIHIWSVKDGEVRRVTGGMFSEYQPAWDPEGNYLYYLSDRQFAPQIGSYEWNYVVDRETEIFALALRKDVAHPFPPESDEVTMEGEEEEKDEDKDESKDKKGKKKKYIEIDFDGLADRVARVPVPADNYDGLSANKGHILFVRRAPFYYGRSGDFEPELHIFSIEDREDKVLVEDIRGYALSQDGSKVLVREGSSYKLYDAKPGGGEGKKVSTSGLEVDRIPAEEWAQIFDEVWRRFRDFFYVPNMHGYDWTGLREQYRPLLQHVAHRSDLNYVIGEMIAELSVSHAYIAGGDFDLPERPKAGLPGVTFEVDEEAGRCRIARIFRGQNEEERYRSPLTEIGIDVSEGSYVLAIDGEDLRANDNPYRMLLHKNDRPVTLTVNDKPSMRGAREVTYNPIGSERALHYLDWVARKREMVSKMTDERVGYIHIPDMGSNGIREFIKWYYGQIRKEGLVVDVRNNGGGNVSQMLIERLRREVLGTRFARTVDTPRTCVEAEPFALRVVFHGQMVCILDEDSASDGDIFPHMFRQAGLGPLIGKRSWGGVIGITNRGTLVDGGSVYVPEFGTNAVDGSWVIEGHGVDPDIVVDNDPKSVLEGRDPQLERAIAEVLERMRREPKRLPTRPKDPVRTHVSR
ncbi:MAG: S41 family peptidase [Candidatus Krumholzibacteriia bacterium]